MDQLLPLEASLLPGVARGSDNSLEHRRANLSLEDR